MAALNISNGGDCEAATERSRSDPFGAVLYGGSESDRVIVERVAQVARDTGLTRAQVALAWVAGQPGVTAPIVGATRPHHLDEAVAAVDVRLDPAHLTALTEPYVPHPIAGFD